MKRLLATTALVAVMAMPVMAEGHMTNAATGDQVNAAQHMEGDMTISVANLMGKALFAPEGEVEDAMFDTPYTDAPDTWENIADIEDVLITPEGEITAVVVDAGGFLGVGEKRTRITMDDIRLVPEEDDEGQYFALYTGDRSVLEDAEEYEAGQAAENVESDDPNRELSTRDTFASLQDEQMGDGTMTDDQQVAEDTTMTGGQQMADNQRAVEREFGPERDTLESVVVTDLTADDLEGARVYGSDNAWVGDVSDLIITEDGEITHMIVDVGGFLGIGEKPVAITFDQVDIRRDGDWGGLNVYVEATEEEFDSMERWERQS